MTPKPTPKPGLDAGAGMPEPRRSKKFSWSEVDPALTRKLLRAAYDWFGPVDEKARVGSLSDAQLRRTAERVLGRPPKKKLRFALTDTLREGWLPKASGDELKNLTALVNRYDPLGTRQERISFLQNRNRTEGFVENLWAAFIAAHKVEVFRSASGSTVPTKLGRSLVELVGEDAAQRHDPYDHQKAAWVELDRLRSGGGRRSGLVVIPTGGGKTATMVSWIVAELQRRPKLRVMWIADQQELVDQAVREFTAHSRTAPAGFRRTLRAVHGNAGAASVLASPDVDIVCATRQSLIGKRFDRKSQGTIKSFLVGPTIVVIDEAHHAVSPTYQQLIEFVWGVGNGVMLVGLTATPWPAGAGQTAVLRKTFPRELVAVTTAKLIESGDLARPVIHTVTTSEKVDVTADDLKLLASGREMPSRVARQLDREARNQLVVQQWVQRRDLWGKTLVFACDTSHADSLGDAFQDAGVQVDVVHSSAGVDRSAVLEDFKRAKDARVLVSVGMLLEGVDIPSARTAFLCRPTASHIVLRQMVGRVLRGVRAGGEVDAHVVEFVDQWRENGQSLSSATILSTVDLSGVPARLTGAGEGVAEHELPPVLTDDGETEVGNDLIRSVARQIQDRVLVDGLTATLTTSRLVGFYDLDVRRIPVFAQTQQAWLDAAEWALDPKDKRGTTAKALFDDVPPPSPRNEEVAAFVAYCKSYAAAPAFVTLDASVDVAATARKLIDAGPLTALDRIGFLRTAYESSLARSIFPSLQAFIEAVEQESLAQLKVIPSGARPEVLPTPEVAPSETLARSSKPRDLQALLKEVATAGADLLSAEGTYDGWLAPAELPDIDWTRREIRSAWAYWSWRKGAKARDRPIIRINRALDAPKAQVPDELLKYLIWHELCHHLTPGQGHGAEFRRLESMWPDHARLDAQLDTLHEIYAIPMKRSR